MKTILMIGGGVLLVIGIGLFVHYGTLSPCGMLAKDMRRTFLKEVGRTEQSDTW